MDCFTTLALSEKKPQTVFYDNYFVRRSTVPQTNTGEQVEYTKVLIQPY